ncbi:hypothetical protein [Tsukamurella tyrosinosolvens]|uniref:hypothetical protein n=1 Tax=Tsukamurella tyrosinosolvens TaxID=57704 RepID=UPI002DD44404|nr:hypothetical protein [Tsukamurella tyrosinosolvens]MEC4616189.1 hypothetical protein [Tsukamurella tyrosinosolvens]
MAAAKKKPVDDPIAEVEQDRADFDDAHAAAQDNGSAPEPGDADYDWTQHYPKGAKLYVHTYPDGQTVALRRFGDITSKQWMVSVSHLRTDFDIESAAFERGACPEAIVIIRTRPAPVDGPDDFQDLWNAWTKDSNDGEVAEPGE